MDYILLSFGLLLTVVIIFIIAASFTDAIRQAQKNLIAALPHPALIIDKDGFVRAVNYPTEKFLEKSSQQILKQPVDTILPLQRDSKSVTYNEYKSLSPNAPIADQSFSYLTASGKTKGLQVTITPLKPKQRMTSDMFISLHDTAGEQQLEEMKVDFVSMAAHELRTPLTAIRGYTSLLQMHYGSQFTGQAKELLTRLLVSTNNLTNLIDNLLSVSRIERNSMIVDAKPLDMKVLIVDIFQSFKQQAETRHQQFMLNMPDKIALVNVDPFRIGQVLINLISNAINYTPEKGIVTVTVTEENNSIVVSIKDTGEGIPEEAMPRLFTKFFRVSGSLEQGSKGTGLGLYITKSIVEMHNGKIWAESTLGKGSTFTFTIPLATAEDIEKYKNHTQSTSDFLTVKNTQGIIVKKRT